MSPSTGRLADPQWRKGRASRAGRARTTAAYHARKLAEAVEPLSDEQLADLRRQVAESRARQGLPPTIEDPATLERVAAIFRLVDPHSDDDDGGGDEPDAA